MLILTVPGIESFDSEKSEFLTSESTELHLEHSLVSLSKWESKWEKPFLTQETKSSEEVYDYIRCMSLDGDIPEETLSRLTTENLQTINKHIESKMTATWFADAKTTRKTGPPPVITAEIIYHWIVSLNIPIECEHWHLNKLITLVKVINEKNAEASNHGKSGRRPHTRSELDARRALNEARRKQAESTG